MKSALSSDYFRDSAVAMAANFLCQLYLCCGATDAAEAEMEVVSNPVQPIKDFQKKKLQTSVMMQLTWRVMGLILHKRSLSNQTDFRGEETS